MVASDRQVIYWAPKRKRPLHSSAYRLILQWGRVLRFDTARAVAVHSSSGHTISQLLSRNKFVISAHAQEAWSVTSGGHSHSCGLCTQVFIDLFDTAQATECTLFISSRHISVSVTKQVCCKLLIFFSSNNSFRITLGLISGFLGKSCRSEKIVTDFQTNMQLGQLGFQPSKHGRQVLPNSVLQENSDFYIKYHTST